MGKENDGIIRIDFPGYSGEDPLEEIHGKTGIKFFRTKKLTLF